MSVPTALAIEVTAATTLAAAALPATLDVSIDSRTLSPGQTYLAIRGPSFDGHDFVGDALAAGAAALVVSERGVVPDGAPALVVADTAHALLALGGAARRLSAARVVAITGSAGKTTTKALLAHLLERAGRGTVTATPANENNEIGVAKLLLRVPRDAAFAVVEFGARHAGDIAPLATAARPDVAILTNVGEAHLEIFGSPEALADTKWAIFGTGARPVLNAGDATSRTRAPSLGRPVVWFAAGDRGADEVRSDDAFVSIRPAANGHILAVRGSAGARETLYPCAIAIAGAHNLVNLAAAAAGAYALGLEPGTIAAGCADATLPAGRYERIEFDDFALVYDAYNASTSGMLATLASFSRERGARRIAVLGSMAELGDDAPEMHARVGAAAASSALDALLVGGDFAGDLVRGALAGGLPEERIVRFVGNADAIAWLARNARAGDVVLLKASRRYKLEEIVEGLRTERGRIAPAHG